MGDIVNLASQARVRLRSEKRTPSRRADAQVLLFDGVRIERHSEVRPYLVAARAQGEAREETEH